MQADELTACIRQLRARPIWGDEANDSGPQPPVDALLPQRAPFVFVDAIGQVDFGGGRLRASRRLRPDDPVFAGHFPNDPVYPGVLLLEAVGQAANCLLTLLAAHGETAAASDAPAVRTVRILHALFLHPVRPNDTLDLQVTMIAIDTMTATYAGQVWVADTLCCLVVAKGHYVGA
jgi:3-hydroxyacyl-[acyl-carrier-protein] dehydratase